MQNQSLTLSRSNSTVIHEKESQNSDNTYLTKSDDNIFILNPILIAIYYLLSVSVAPVTSITVLLKKFVTTRVLCRDGRTCQDNHFSTAGL